MSTRSLKARLAAVTPGPWFWDGEHVPSGYEGESLADADLIAHAPTDLAAALKVIEAVERLMTGDLDVLGALDAWEALP